MKEGKCTAIILAAGQGKRMGGQVRKQFMELQGKPLLYYSLHCFQESGLIDEILLVTGKDQIEYCIKNVVERYGFSKVVKIVAGGEQRYDSVYEGLKACGVECIREISGDYSYESGIRMAQELLDQGPLDAVICATDRLAFGAYRVLEGHGLRIPEDVSVAGFGGYDESTLLKPELTTLKFDSYGLGYLGAETLLKMIREEPVPKKQIVGYRMIEGKSVRK